MAGRRLCSDQRWCWMPVITRRHPPRAIGAFTTFVSGSPTGCLPAMYSRSTATDSAKSSSRTRAEGARQEDAVGPVLAGRARGQEVVGPRAGVWDQLPQRDLRAVHLVA